MLHVLVCHWKLRGEANHSASLKVSSNLGSKARWRKGDRELEADLQTLIARVMPAGYASSRGKGCFIADHTSLQHVCRSRCKLLLASHCLLSRVPSACAMQISTCTMRQMSVGAGRLSAAGSQMAQAKRSACSKGLLSCLAVLIIYP